VAKSEKALEHKSGGWIFAHAEQAQKAALALGADLNLPPWALSRRCKLKEHKDGKLLVEMPYDTMDRGDAMDGWVQEGKFWTRIFEVKTSAPTGADLGTYDDMLRHLVTSANENCGWVIRSDNLWRVEPLAHVGPALGSFGLNPKDTKLVIGSCTTKPWTLVNLPFQPEYPGDRAWNRDSAQFRFFPSENIDNLSYPHWSLILNHVGHGLNLAVKNHPWCRAHGIQTGADYLKVWLASLFQKPREPLPYLFLYSMEQNTGKSIFHEAVSMLLTCGVVRADTALTSDGSFNAELEKAVLCVVEETDLRRNKQAYSRIKDWVTARQLPIHRKGETPYTIVNTTHWIQCSNAAQDCPIQMGDTRITMVQVPPLDPTELIPKTQLLMLLEKEASDFMAALLSTEVPPSNDRLAVPVIATAEKMSAAKSNQTELERFIDEKVHRVDGKTIKFSEFFETFREALDASSVGEWTKIKVGRELPTSIPKGRNPKDGQFHIANVSWEARKPGDTILPKLVVVNEMLVPYEEAVRIK
jgi:hypothetical protein